MATDTYVYDVHTVFTHPDGKQSYKPLMLTPNAWEQLRADGLTTNLRYGYTKAEAELAARLSMPILRAEHQDFIAAGGTIENEVGHYDG